MSRLPEKDTTESDNLIKTYLTCNSPTVDKLAEQYGYADRRNFTDAMRRRYGARRERNAGNDNEIDRPCPLTMGLQHKNQFIKQSNINPELYLLSLQGTALLFQDAHHPFANKECLNIIRRFAKELQPDVILIPGDWWDIYQLSKFDKDPNRARDLQHDINLGINTLYWIKQDCPNSKMIFLDGNHEDRIRKNMWAKTPETAVLDSSNPDELLGLIKLEIDRVPKTNRLLINDKYQVLHGEVVRKHSGDTARAHYEKFGGNGIIGHSHRGGLFNVKTNNIYGWTENYCTCVLNPMYVMNPNWLNGFTVVTFIKDLFFVEPVPMFNNRFIYGGKLYE